MNDQYLIEGIEVFIVFVIVSIERNYLNSN